ncbi:MAG: 3-dehydroquinate synthase [Vicinamibacterales bacterium]|jgi:3-dehydroquinate synthase
MEYGFSVPFAFPLHFTRGVFAPDNPLLAGIVRRLEPARRHRLLAVVDARVAATNPALVDGIARYAAAHDLELAAAPVIVPGGEAVKNDLAHPLALLQKINDVGLDRQSFVAVVGGGAVLDTASFAAAIAHRGIRVVRVPTTVLSQADSGVGVKNSVNLFGKKNFIGTFVPPFAVINDFEFLESLDRRDRISGIAEVVKVAVLKDAPFFDDIEANATQVAADSAILARVIRRSAELHLHHICGNGDPFELGSARPLDFGHWAAHKLEGITGHRLRHGEAVAIGIALDLTYSVRMGYLDRAAATRVTTVLEAIGFQLWDDALEQRDQDGRLSLLSGLREFREHLGGELHITLLRSIGDGFEVTDMNAAEVVASIEELSAMRPANVGR